MEAAIVNCPHDGAIMEYGVKEITIKYKGLSKSVQMPGWYCPECGEGIHSGKDLKITDRALNELKSQCEGFFDANEIRRIRKKLHLTQKDAGMIIGGGPRAFQKYESGELLPSRAIISALTLLDSNPRGIELLTKPTEDAHVARACA